MRPTFRRGFTLIEVMVAVALVGILASIGVVMMARGTKTSRLNGSTIQAMGIFRSSQHAALRNGFDVVLVLLQGVNADACGSGDLFGGAMVTDTNCTRFVSFYEDSGVAGFTPFTDASLSAFDPAAPLAAGYVAVDRGTLDRGIRIGLAPGYTPPVLPAPFSVPAHGIAGCNFCTISPVRTFVRFTARGEVALRNGASGGSLFLTTGAPGETRGFVVTAPTGMVTARFWADR